PVRRRGHRGDPRRAERDRRRAAAQGGGQWVANAGPLPPTRPRRVSATALWRTRWPSCSTGPPPTRPARPGTGSWRWPGRTADKQGRLRWTKPPYQADGSHAKSNDPGTWTAFDLALLAYRSGGFSGVGYCLKKSADEFTILDFDDGRDPQTGEVLPWAAELLG